MGVAPRNWDAILARLAQQEELELDKVSRELWEREEPPTPEDFRSFVADVRLLHRRLERQRAALEREAGELRAHHASLQKTDEELAARQATLLRLEEDSAALRDELEKQQQALRTKAGNLRRKASDLAERKARLGSSRRLPARKPIASRRSPRRRSLWPNRRSSVRAVATRG
jgi:chromosome segregation ATPase